MISLDDYISRANSEKKEIYYIIGKDEKILRNSPLLEAYKKNDIEVLICDDKEIDEIVTPAIGTYEDWELKDITSCEAPKTEQTEEEKNWFYYKKHVGITAGTSTPEHVINEAHEAILKIADEIDLESVVH